MRVRYSSRAIRNLRSIFAYIEKENPAAAARVVSRIESVVQELGHTPGMGSPTSKPGVHRFPVSGTPYLIFYEIFEGEVAIIRIRHGARRPWAGSR